MNPRISYRWTVRHRARVTGLLSLALITNSLTADPSQAALVDAVEKNNPTVIAGAWAEDVDVNASQVDGMTALHWAVYHDNTATALELLARGANASAENRYGIQPLYLACLNGNAGLVKALLEKGADANASIDGGETVLMTASRTGSMESVIALLKAGADVNGTERKGQSAIMWAAAEGRSDVVQTLVDAGADFKTPLERSGFTPFLFAVRQGHTETVRVLLNAGAELNGATKASTRGRLPKRGTSPLLMAVENGHYDLAVELLDAGADPNDARSGFTILHSLTWIRKPDIGESSAGDPKPQGSGQRTSLDFVREIVSRGADVNARLERGRKAGRGHVSTIGATPLFLAADRADLAYMQLLVELGADPLIPNKDGTTPLLVAAGIGSTAPEEEAGSEAECLAAAKYLVSLGAEIDTVDANGETAMHGAAYKNIPSMVHYLNELGADISLWNAKNKLGWTPLLIAEGYRPGNFKPSFATAEAITQVMLANGVKPPSGPKPKHTNYAD